MVCLEPSDTKSVNGFCRQRARLPNPSTSRSCWRKSGTPVVAPRPWKFHRTPWRKTAPATSNGTRRSSQISLRTISIITEQWRIISKPSRNCSSSSPHQQRKKKPVAIINLDDRYGQKLVGKIANKVSVVTFGTGLKADFRASNYRMEFGGTSYQLDARGKSYLVRVPLIGRFNVANSVAALAAANALGVGLREAVLSLAKSPQVPGRLEMVPAKRQFQVFVDYAHTPDALLNVIKTLRELQPRRLIVVFGCGGNRDREKRPLMGQVVDQNADYAIITSDNPRKEDPEKIIAEVEQGLRGSHFEKITDRAAAIKRAVELAQPRDIVLIAGKGHENYQEFADHTVPFEDIQVARRAIEGHPVEFK